MDYQYKENTFGEMFGKGFGMFFDNFLPLIGISVIMFVPLAFFEYLLTKESFKMTLILQSTGELPTSYLGTLFLSVGIIILETLLVSSVLTYYISNRVLHKEESFGSVLKRALKKIVPLLGLSIVASLMIMLGMLFLIIPGIIMALSLSIVVPVMLLEDKGIMDSIRRSRELTKGAKGRIFWVMFLQGVLIVILSLILQKIAMSIAGGMILSGGFDTFILILFLFSAVSSIIGSAFGGCMTLSVYFSRRSEKDGLDLEQAISGYIQED